jgi:acetoin:2,6-dichlorophenolindophenol oxidoreductase subunit beta
VLESLSKTNRLAVVEEGPLTGGWAGEIVALVAEHGLDDIDDVWRLTTADHPIPYSPALEDACLPSTEAIVASVNERLGVGAGAEG